MKRLNPQAKCVYIAPLKSLARERLKEWKKRLGGKPLHWKVLELSGDTHHDRRTLEHADVLVCTPVSNCITYHFISIKKGPFVLL